MLTCAGVQARPKQTKWAKQTKRAEEIKQAKQTNGTKQAKQVSTRAETRKTREAFGCDEDARLAGAQ